MAYTMGTSGERNIVNVNGNRYFADKSTPSVTTKAPTTTTQYKAPSRSYSSSGGGSSSASSYQPAVAATPAYDPSADAAAAAAEYQSRILAELKAAEEAQRKAREEAYNKAAAAQKSTYDNNVSQLNGATDKALQQAYINRMLQQRNLQQQLTAQGISGGASETTQASMLNNYQNSRNDLETERQRQLANLMQVYQNNMAALEQQRASGENASLGQYQTALSNLAANNGVNLVSLMQGNTATSYMPTARYVNGEWVYY